MNWMTVKEVAGYLKLSEIMVYKLAQKGEIPAAKIGSSWRFSQDEIDRWLLAKSVPAPSIPPHVREVVDDIHAHLQKEFGNDIASLIVFGSFARGDATEDSDLDLLVLFKNISDYWKTAERVRKIAYACTYAKGRTMLTAPVIMLEKEFLTGSSPLVLTIRKEGIRAA